MDKDVESALKQTNKRLDDMADSLFKIKGRVEKEADDHLDILERLLSAEHAALEALSQTAKNTASLIDMKTLMEVQVKLLKAQLQPMVNMKEQMLSGFRLVKFVFYGILSLAALLTAYTVIITHYLQTGAG